VPVPAQVEISRKAPNRVLTTYRTPTNAISDGFDGATKWAQDANGRVTEAVAIDQLRARRTSDLYESVNLKQQYARFEVLGLERVHDRDAYVMLGFPANDLAERLYFDRDTSLLVRKVSYLRTAVGNVPWQIDYDDYRDAGNGVKVPYVVELFPANPRVELQVTATLRVQKVQENVQIDDTVFTKPASAPAPRPRP
jgi:hypothetical protein